MSQRVAVVGAGMVGLSTAWFLQEHGFEVTVYDRRTVAAGSSWGNAGWLTPALTAPLPEPAVLSYGVRAVLSPSSPVYVPLRPDPRLLRFLTRFALHSTLRHWESGMRAYVPLNQRALAAFDELTDGGVDARTSSADPFLACFRTTEERTPLLQEIRRIENAGQEVKFDVLTGDEARAAEPALSSAIESAVKLYGQRFIDPPAFLAALADSILERGGRIVEDTSVTGVDDDVAGRVAIRTQSQRDEDTFDSVVLANGAWLGDLARRFGVRQPLQAGRGYSFSVDGARLPRAPVYFPAQRVACTPLSTAEGPRLRVAGMMEFRPPDAALDRRRIAAIVEATRPLLGEVDFEDRHDEWVGSRPCTADGLPLIGATSSPRVFVAGGHGMWGIALGPLTGKLLALQMATGTAIPALKPFIPTRRPGRIGDPRW